MNSIITRFAPSPTGNLHIGGIRTALINYIVTKQYKKKYPKSKFFLRIEDTDKKRSNNEFTDNIINGLKWMNINYDSEPIFQSQNIERHKEIAFKLLKKNKAFKCICSTEILEERRKINKLKKILDKKICKTCENNEKVQTLKKDFTIRLKVPNEGKTIINDIIQGEINVQNKEIDDFILLRKDNSPTYMLSVVVDDYDMGVNLIIRGDDHLNNVFRQNFIYTNMNWKTPRYGHIPLIHGSDGMKLSKRHGAVSISNFEEQGYLKESIINNLILLGWSPNKSNEILEIEEIIDLFNINKISKSSSIFNYDKLNFFNNYFINNDKNYMNFHNYCKKSLILNNLIKIDEDKLLRLFNIYKKNINSYKELEDLSKPYFEENYKTKYIEKIQNDFSIIVKNFLKIIEKINNWESVDLEKEINNFVETNKIKFSNFGKPLRLLLINSKTGPAISDILFVLGKKNSIERIKDYISKT